MTLPPAPMQGLSNMNSAGLQQAPMQAAAMARPVQTQPVAAPNAATQQVPPQMQALQAQLAGLAQAGAQPNMQAMQSVLGMMGPGAGMNAPPPSLGGLINPMGAAPQAGPAPMAPMMAPGR